MEWIKQIIAKHTDENGKVDIKAANKEIDKEFPLNAVPKEQYNNISTQLKTANDTLAELKEQTKDNPDIQKQLTEAKEAQEKAEKELTDFRTKATITEKLREAGAKDVDYALYKLGSLETNKDGSIKDLDNKIKDLQTNLPDYFNTKDSDKDDSNKNPLGSFTRVNNNLKDGQNSKTISMDRLQQMTPQEINENWDAVSASLENGGN